MHVVTAVTTYNVFTTGEPVSMRFKFGITLKGLILVGVPLVTNLALIAWLLDLYHQSERELERASHVKDVIRGVHKFHKDVLDAATAAGAYNLSGRPIFSSHFEEALQLVRADLPDLDRLTRSNPREQQMLNYAKQVAEHGLKLFTRMKERQGGPQTLRTFFGSAVELQQLRVFLEQFGGVTRDIVDEEERELAAVSAKGREKRQALVDWLYIAIVVDLVMAIGLAAFFRWQITRRLRIMTENTARVTRNEPLHPPIGDDDEIAHLDRVFHDMVNDLKLAEQTKQQLMQMVSHDLRAPLTSVRAVLTILASGALGELSEKAQGRVAMADSEVERLIKLINDLLDAEKMTSGKLEIYTQPVELLGIMKKAANAVAGPASERSIKVDLIDCDLRAVADDERLIQVIVNLLSNAIKFSPQESTVTLEAQAVEDWVEVRIIDRGRGVPPEFASGIFERFTQVSEGDQAIGTGLGLSICKTIVEKHGGTIGVRPNQGGGSVFWFRVPLEKSPPLEEEVQIGHNIGLV